MAHIYYDIDGFAAPLPNGLTSPAAGGHRASPARMVWAAITIGTTPFGPQLRAGRALELQWRSAMLRASIEPARRAYWRSGAYDRLDPAEKGAVSFFLGQTQAKLFAHDFFRVSRFVHYDAYLAYLGRPRRRTRPDFVGFHGRRIALAVEAKGRSLGYTNTLVRRAKKQATSLPGIRGHRTSTTYVHIAYFHRGQWHAYLEDPPRQRSMSVIDPADLTAAYYLPIVQAIRERQGQLRGLELADGRYLTAVFAEADLTVSVPAYIAELIRTEDGISEATGSRASRAAELYDLVLGLDEQVGAQGRKSSPEDNRHFLGGDGVAIELGESWGSWLDQDRG
jgi:hypothetical protein